MLPCVRRRELPYGVEVPEIESYELRVRVRRFDGQAVGGLGAAGRTTTGEDDPGDRQTG